MATDKNLPLHMYPAMLLFQYALPAAPEHSPQDKYDAVSKSLKHNSDDQVNHDFR